MACTIPPEKIVDTIAFHGHSCPGLAIGIRAAEYALLEFERVVPESLLCVTETDMCGVDAIQFLTGCTFGKGNLIHRDYGKVAFTFHDRQSGRAVRFLLNPGARGPLGSELHSLREKATAGKLTESEEKRVTELRTALQEHLLNAPLAQLFMTSPITSGAPRPARVLASLTCAKCGEDTMESRTRRFAGETLCIPCYGDVEQKI